MGAFGSHCENSIFFSVENHLGRFKGTALSAVETVIGEGRVGSWGRAGQRNSVGDQVT